MTDVSGRIDLLRLGQPLPAHQPWPCRQVSPEEWVTAAEQLAEGHWMLIALWGEAQTVRMALREDAGGSAVTLRLDCPQGRFPSVALRHRPADRLERALRDLTGLEPEDAPDRRPWLDHGRWGVKAPLAAATPAPELPATAYRFLPVEGEGLHQIPVGPVHAGTIEPGHFRFTAAGETVVRLEARLGYAHKGIIGLLRDAELPRAARLAARVSGDSTVAYSLAFARAVEAASGCAVPERAQWLRALMSELERVANHLGDIGAICNDAAFARMLAEASVLREEVLRCAAACWGHRLMMDGIVPGGVARDLDDAALERLRGLLERLRRRFPELAHLYDNTASLKDRTVGTGLLRPELALRFGCGGYVGRASGHGFDARRRPGYPPYDRLSFEVPVLRAGDVNARVFIRIREVGESLALLGQLLDGLPPGPHLLADVPSTGSVPGAEGAALVEGFRGDVFAWVRLGPAGRVESAFLRDPSWFQWPLLEAVIEGNIVADFPLCNKSFNCSYSGHDL